MAGDAGWRAFKWRGGFGQGAAARERLRKDWLERQRRNRQAAADRARAAFALLRGSADALMGPPPQADSFPVAPRPGGGDARGGAGRNELERGESYNSRRRRLHFAEQLMVPDWLVDVPEDLCEKWLVIPRPEGRRCLLVAARGVTVTLNKNGSLLHRFQSSLPGGSRATQGGSAMCVLDCVFYDPEQVYYALDVLFWRDQPLCDAPTEVRQFCLHARLQELEARCLPSAFRIRAVPSFPATRSGLAQCYQPTMRPASFAIDGILFLHRETQYEAGVNPLVLAWKDKQCSRFYLPCDEQGVAADEDAQTCVLALREDGRLVALHGEVVWELHPDEFRRFASSGPKLIVSGAVSPSAGAASKPAPADPVAAPPPPPPLPPPPPPPSAAFTPVARAARHKRGRDEMADEGPSRTQEDESASGEFESGGECAAQEHPVVSHRLVRCTVKTTASSDGDGLPVVSAVTVLGAASRCRVLPDPLGRILFEGLARAGRTISVQAIVEAMARQEARAADKGAAPLLAPFPAPFAAVAASSSSFSSAAVPFASAAMVDSEDGASASPPSPQPDALKEHRAHIQLDDDRPSPLVASSE